MEEKEKQRPVPDIRDPRVPPVHSARPELPRQRNIIDAFTDAVLTVAYYGEMKARSGNYDSHMDQVREGEYEF